MKLAYFTNQYPKASHSFIRREIEKMEAAGVEVLRISVRRAGEELADEGDRRELEKTRLLLKRGAGGAIALIGAAIGMALCHPVRFMRALEAALGLARCGRRSLAVHVAYLVEACLLKRWLEREKVAHVHVHFGTNPAAVAMLCRMLGGPTYSVTVHGPDEFDEPRALGLDRKARLASMVVGVSQYGCSQLARWVDRGMRRRYNWCVAGWMSRFLAGI